MRISEVMLISDLMEKLEEIAPLQLQESWDNSGLQIGSKSDIVGDIVISLDIDEHVVENSPTGATVITHHPLIFSGLKSFDQSKYPANLIKKMLAKELKLISLHTNYDKAVLNRYVLQNVLGWKGVENIGDYILVAEIDMERDDFLRHVKERLKIERLKVTDSLPERVSKVALTTGSGGSFISQVSTLADIFLTGDLKYHDAMEAKSVGLGVVDIGHYESEILFSRSLQEILEEIQIEATVINSKNPFRYWRVEG
jgi:dinuclear metal center YbgI/SA1388 family protein